jgi:transketolase
MCNMDRIVKLVEKAHRLRLMALAMAYKSGSNGAHLGGGLSTIEIFATLYGNVLNLSEGENRDRLIVSKGHCVLAYYTALFEAGYLTQAEIDSFETNGSPFHGHATRDLTKGIEFSGGSLSMGISFAVGVALACKRKGLNNKIYALIGDGECDEGLVWESAMAASAFHLDNFVVIVDCNKIQYDGFTSEIMSLESLGSKFKSFGFQVTEVDGHDCAQLSKAFHTRTEKPYCIIANTVKGKGVSFMENKKEWHHAVLPKDLYEQSLKELSL